MLDAGSVTPAITLIVVIAGVLALAAWDIWRHEVEDWATAGLLGAAVIGLSAEGISASQWLSGAASAALAFGVYLYLGMRGLMGGGDVKLAGVPALVLGASNPFLGVWWLSMSFLIHQAIVVTVRRSAIRAGEGAVSAPVALPHVPAMAAAMVLATVVFPASV